jgi:predicted lipase
MKILLIAASLLVSSFVSAESYSFTTGLRTMYYSSAAHCSVDVLEKWNCGEPCSKNPGVEQVSPIINQAAGTYGFVGYNPNEKEILVSFRGSVNVANWITNINFLKESYNGVAGAEVHSGFYEAYKGVRDQVIGSVMALHRYHPSAKFTVTGHSLGGALATFAAMDIKEHISS